MGSADVSGLHGVLDVVDEILLDSEVADSLRQVADEDAAETQRIRYVRPIEFQAFHSYELIVDLEDWVEGVWCRLGRPIHITSASDTGVPLARSHLRQADGSVDADVVAGTGRPPIHVYPISADRVRIDSVLVTRNLENDVDRGQI